jgi:hypothetical protein
MLLRKGSGRRASIRLVLACVFVFAVPLVAIPQDCSSFGNATAEDLQTLSAELSQARVLEQERGAAAYQRIWNNADVAVKDIYNFNLGLFFGRAEDYEKLQSTLNDAQIAFKMGQRKRGMSITLDLFKQASALTSRIGGTLNPVPYTDLPNNPKDAKDFVDNAVKVVKQYAVDGKGQVVALGRTGDAMADLENSNLAQASLADQIAEIQRCMSYAPHARPVPQEKANLSTDGASTSVSQAMTIPDDCQWIASMVEVQTQSVEGDKRMVALMEETNMGMGIQNWQKCLQDDLQLLSKEQSMLSKCLTGHGIATVSNSPSN